MWFLIEAAMSGQKIKEVYLGRKDHTSFEAYEKDIGKLHKMAEQVLFTILNEAVKYGKFKSQYNQVSLKNIFMQPTENVQTILKTKEVQLLCADRLCNSWLKILIPIR